MQVTLIQLNIFEIFHSTTPQHQLLQYNIDTNIAELQFPPRAVLTTGNNTGHRAGSD